MATLVLTCPHPDCLAEKMTFDVMAVSNTPSPWAGMRAFAHVACRKCGQPAAVELEPTEGMVLSSSSAQFPHDLMNLNQRIVRVWPEIPAPKLPDHLPAEVARAFLSGERTFLSTDMEEASAGSYGRALELATKAIAPELAKQPLFNRIERLTDAHRITPDLKSWAHAIRLIRNSALHDVDQITRDELIAIRGFTELLLTYLFTLPGMLRARQSDTHEKPEG